MNSNYSMGHEAESAAARYLEQNGFVLVAINWRTKVCEIDIVAQKHKTIHFVEVKYRKTTLQGSGLDYITQSKLRRMTFAAELWVSQHAWRGEYQLSAIEVSGYPFEITQFIPNLT